MGKGLFFTILAILVLVWLIQDNSKVGLLYYVGFGERVQNRYPNGTIKEEYLVRKDKIGNYLKHGTYISYYENGMKATEVNYSCNKKNGKECGWNNQGELNWETNYRNDTAYGKERDYSNGKLVGVIPFTNGMYNGVYERFDSAGQIVEVGSYKNADPIGYRVTCELATDGKYYLHTYLPNEYGWYALAYYKGDINHVRDSLMNVFNNQ